MFKNNENLIVWDAGTGSKEDKYRYMVEYLGVTGDAGGVDVLVFFAFTLLAHPHSLSLSPQVNAPLPCMHPLIRVDH